MTYPLSPDTRPAKPRPVFETMPNAVRAAIICGNTLADIKLPSWATTYRCGVEDIRLAWEAELTRRSQEPTNQYDTEGK